MSEVFAPRYLAGLVSTHGWLRSRHLCQTPLNGGEAYPVRTWLSSWNRAIQIQSVWSADTQPLNHTSCLSAMRCECPGKSEG